MVLSDSLQRPIIPKPKERSPVASLRSPSSLTRFSPTFRTAVGSPISLRPNSLPRFNSTLLNLTLVTLVTRGFSMDGIRGVGISMMFIYRKSVHRENQEDK